MQLNRLTAISPLDGRYGQRVFELSDYFSEYALMRHRLMMEVEYFIALCEIPLPQLSSFDKQAFIALRDIYTSFSQTDAQRVKDIERTTNHDVKAIEYFLKEKFETLHLSQYAEFIHFGLTSQDVNNTAIPMMIRDALEKVLLPSINEVNAKMLSLSQTWENIPMLARTHGQPASPTRLGKEIFVFVERLNAQLNLLKQIPNSAKFGGATGNFNAHYATYPSVDWVAFANDFVDKKLGLQRLQTTTQIEHYDNMAALFDAIKRINVVLLDWCRDAWTYISMDYFGQKIKEQEVGSSAMPHKVNPIDFENAEGNFGIANALLVHLSEKLPISRLQRDLTDSTVLRNIGVPFAHSLIAYKSILKGLEKIILNPRVLAEDLEKNWVVVSEAIQTILRREGFPKPYEALKELTRTNQTITKETLHQFIDTLHISDEIKQELKTWSPYNYTGINFRNE